MSYDIYDDVRVLISFVSATHLRCKEIKAPLILLDDIRYMINWLFIPKFFVDFICKGDC